MSHKAIVDRSDLGLVGVEYTDEAGQIIKRRSLPPVRASDGVWIDTNVSDLSAEAQAVCAGAWTAKVKAAYIADYEAKNGPLPTPEEEAAAAQARLVDAIKDEAYRRIIAICPEWKQRNLTAQAAILAKKGEANWTQEEAAAWAAGEAIWTQIAAIRAASDELEAMDPMPADFKDEQYWP